MVGYQTLYRTTPAQQHTLVQRVCYLLATGLAVTAMGAWVFQAAYDLCLVFFIATFALIFVMRAVARKPGVNVLVFYLFSLAEGGMLGPYLGHFANHIPNGGNLIWEAFLLTSVTVAGVGGYAYMSGKDFGFLGRFLFWALIGLIIVGFASWFVLALDTSVMVLGYETIFVAVFVGFLLYDFSNIRLRYSPEDYTMAAVQVYLDFINLFLAILRILSILQGGGVRRN